MAKKESIVEAEEKLLYQMKTEFRILTGRCEVVVCNGTPPEWNVTILEAGVKFFYRDETDDTDGPRLIHLAPKNCTSFYSGSSDKCVKQVYAVLKVRVQGQPKDGLYEWRDGVPEGECLKKTEIMLKPKSSILESEVTSKDWTLAFELSKLI